MFKAKIGLIAVLISSAAHTASLSITGNHRFGSNMFVNMDLGPGQLAGAGNTSSFLEHRLLLRPDILIDEHFTVKTEWHLLQLNNGTSSTLPAQAGTPLDNRLGVNGAGQYINISRAYLRWASDWGIFRVGRMPLAWGLGVVYDPGDNPWDDYSSTGDRASFQALVGGLELNVAYEKGEESALNNDHDDVDIFEGSIEYANAESQFNIGILYGRHVRSANSFARTSTGINGQRNSSHDLSLFLKKQWSSFFVGSEFALNSHDKQPDTVGWLGRWAWTPGAFKLGMDLVYSNKSADKYFLFNENYRPFLIMFRQSTGQSQLASSVRQGGPVGGPEGNGNGGGVYMSVLGISYGFSQNKYVMGADMGYARLEEQGSSSHKSLGTEVDLHFKQAWYDNFHTQYAFGLLFPGDAYGPKSELGWGVQIRGYLEF